jgi:hypothetical protein
MMFVDAAAGTFTVDRDTASAAEPSGKGTPIGLMFTAANGFEVPMADIAATP